MPFISDHSTKKEETHDINDDVEDDYSSLPMMCLETCHKFHTNPSLSHRELRSSRGDKPLLQSLSDGNNETSKLDVNVGTSNGQAQSASSSKALKRKQRLAQYKQSSQPGSALGLAGGGEPCHAIWAPNLNYSKNVELLAIASPLNLNNAAVGQGTGNSSSQQNPSMNQTKTNSSGSQVYILCFDEGAFAHCSEFSLASELCDLFGLPTQNMSTRTISKRCGIRRKVFHNSHLNKSNEKEGIQRVRGEDSPQAMQSQQKESVEKPSTAASSAAIQVQEKAHSLYSHVSSKYVIPFFSHMSGEIQNCANVLKYEVYDDGRVFGIWKGEPGRTVGNEREQKEEDSEQAKMLPSGQDNSDKKQERKDDRPTHPIRPQLVFHVGLPYSNTLMEVTALEWNADGTTLSVTQRRKGSNGSTSYSVVSNVGVTNKKKKPNNVSIAPGNTAVSFWTIPEWLHVACDEVKMCAEDEDLRYEGDGIIVKANKNAEGAVGWEVEKTDENTSLFPLWEWYLARYIFNDEITPPYNGSDKGKRTKIMLKNCMECTAFQMELSSASSSTSTTRYKKGVSRGGRSTGTGENVNSMMNGDVTCLVWEHSPLFDDNDGDERLDDDTENEDGTEDQKSEEKKISVPSSPSISTPSKSKCVGPASKWVAVGTSKGQVLLHNTMASYASQPSKSNSKKSGNEKGALIDVNNIPPQGRTIAVPVRHKKRITCGAWVDNLLVFGHVSTGCITIVSTFPKSMVDHAGDQENLTPTKIGLFEEKSTKILGNIPLPGGRDAINIQMGFIEDELGKLTILSVNCEGKCLLFYSFPKAVDASNINALSSNITSSPAVEVNFSMNSNASSDESQGTSQMKGRTSCGNIIFYYLVPNTLLVFVAFSSGYFALVDWVSGKLYDDADVVYDSTKEFILNEDRSEEHALEHHENFILDVAYHVGTSTIACLTDAGSVLVYHLRVIDDCQDLKPGELSLCNSGIVANTKTHTRPKTKTKYENLIDSDSSVKRVMGCINFLCSRTVKSVPPLQIDARRGNLINFSADGEAISISWGDESVEVLAINLDDADSDVLKEEIAESMYLGKDNILATTLFLISAVMVWYWGKGV
mmetsp:Transcript_2780/g.4063  ORF Transcript_2780/g.4063 Transcript_2780/m.4063 type:complete len:1096 (-) Transcript_2780:60-3347(-)